MQLTARNGIAALVAAAFLAAAAPGIAGPAPSAPSALEEALSTDWVARSQDNICGLRDARTLTHPAKVDYARLLAATPEMQRLKREGIDPASAEGIQLKQAAIDRVARASKTVMEESGHCSVWKRVRHKDGRAIPDITQSVLARL